MPVDIALHPIGEAVNGRAPPAPSFPPAHQQKGLAEDTPSTAIMVLSPGFVLCLHATVKVRVDFAIETADLDPANSAIVLEAGQPRYFSPPKGVWYVETTAFA